MLFAIDIGGSKIRIVGSQLGLVADEDISFTTPQNQRAVVKELQAKIQSLAGRSGVDSIGIAAPGAIDKSRGMMLHTPQLPWRNLKLTSPLQKFFGCPVILENDAACGALHEARHGAGKPYNVFVYVTISTNIGTAICINGQLLPTPHNSEGGHMLLNANFTDLSQSSSFANLVSGRAIIRDFGTIAHNIHSPSIWQEIATRMAAGLYNIATLVQPEAIVLAGGVTANHRRFVPLIKNAWKDMPFMYAPPKLEVAQHIETAPVLGALQLALSGTDHNS